MRISDWSSDVCSSDLRQQFVVALQVFAVVGEALAAEIGLAQLVALDHGAHGAIQDQDALAKQAGEVAAAGIGRRRRSAERRVGKEGVSTCRSRWKQDH